MIKLFTIEIPEVKRLILIKSAMLMTVCQFSLDDHIVGKIPMRLLGLKVDNHLATKLFSHRLRKKDLCSSSTRWEKIRLPRVKKIFDLDIQFLVKYYGIPNPFKDGVPGENLEQNIFKLTCHLFASFQK